MQIEAIVFDIGGVFLHQPEQDVERIAARFGMDGLQLHEMLYGDDLWEMYKRGQFGEDELWQRVASRLPSTFHGELSELRQAVDYAEVIDERLVEIAESLRGSYRVAALSNAGAELERRLDELNLTRLFEHVVNSHRVQMAKPEEEIYHHTCQLLQLEPPQILFVDDKPRNTIVADALGIHTHVYTTVDSFLSFLQQEELFGLSLQE